MIHKIQTSSTTFVSLEVKQLKSEVELFIQKGDARLTFSYDQTKQINAIIESIDPEKFTLKEYWSVKKWSEYFLSTANSATSGLDARMIHSTWESVVANKLKQPQFSKAEVYKVSISEFRGIKSFQIRQRQVSPTYSGYGKLGVSLPTYKIKELQTHMKTIMQEFAAMI